MFGSIGGPELLVIFAIALLIFGPRRLSELGRTLGRGIGEFRKAASDMRDTLDAEVARAELKPPGDPAVTGPAEQPDPTTAADAKARDERT
ncbi:MAG: twin-arginine translocase TatA/TatE family subunit [Acidobacteria bacterium]|nr:twin-arginine translocase TatA/TatE family subunit [Acidobacteriota bacterium]